MTELILYYYHRHHSGRMLARVCTTGFYGITLNLFADDDSDLNLPEGSTVRTQIYGDALHFEVYESEAEYDKAGLEWDSISLEPYGALLMFAKDENDNPVPQEAGVLFSGVVREVKKNDVAGKDEPNYALTVETLDMDIRLQVSYEGIIEEGYIFHADADLHAAIIGK